MPATPPPDLARLFAEAAPRFGLSRPAGACFAAIWRAAQAPSAEDLVTILGLSRSNVSVALKELRERGLIQAARSFGSRKDYFVADPDPWALLRALLTPHEAAVEAERTGDFTARLVSQEEAKTLPFAPVWDMYCRMQNVPVGDEWLTQVRKYEREVMLKR